MTSSPRLRALLLALTPILISGVISTLLIINVIAQSIAQESDRFHQSLNNYLATAVADHVVNNDMLGINVLLSNMYSNGDFDFASVYDANDNLIAQAGQQTHSEDFSLFTQQVTYQSTSAGFVQLGFKASNVQQQVNSVLITSLSIHAGLLLVVSLLVLGLGDFLYLWIMGNKQTLPVSTSDNKSDDNETRGIPELSEPVADEVPGLTFLVIKLRPARLVPVYQDTIEQALALYSGELLSNEGDSFLIQFERGDQIFQAACSALLLLELMPQLGQNLQLKAGLHSVIDGSVEADVAKAKKHASYLASISDRQLLTSRHLIESITDRTLFETEAFHSALTPDGEVFRINKIQNYGLIQSQALQLVTQSHKAKS